MESYLTSVLGQKELIRSKLENPLGVADRVIADTLVNLERRTDALEADVRILEMIDENMNVFKKDIERDVQYYRQHVKLLVTQVRDGQLINNQTDDHVSTNSNYHNDDCILSISTYTSLSA